MQIAFDSHKTILLNSIKYNMPEKPISLAIKFNLLI